MIDWKYSLKALTLIFICSMTALIAEEDTPPPVRAELISEETSIQPGRPFYVGVHLKMQDGWHTYWKNPGDAGMATNISWELPEGIQASPTIWPAPEKFTVDSMAGYGYEDDVLLMVKMTPSAGLSKEKPIQLKANVRWLVCSDSFCVPGDSQIALELPINQALPHKNQQTAALFGEWKEEIPDPIDNVEASVHGELIELRLPVSGEDAEEADAVIFFPEEQGIIDHTFEALLDPSRDSAQHSLLVLKASQDKPEGVAYLKGVLALMTKQGDALEIAHVFEINTKLKDTAEQATAISMADVKRPAEIAPTPVSSEENLGFGMALLLAFIGGMILNLMPCVLPVISFKVLSFVKIAKQSRLSIFKHGLLFSFGVLISFWILAGVLLMLQAYGHAAGWGFQLQEPIFVAFLAAFLLAFACSLFGVYELGDSVTTLAGKAQTHVSHKHEGHLSSFLSGILATTVATPCTGPFLGSVVGLAITVSPYAAMLLFTFMGLGMAFPYLIFALFPNLMKFLPKPGPWMDTFKQLMGFVMLATVLWLLWVFGAQTDSNALVMLLSGFFVLSIGCWIYGKWGSSLNAPNTRVSSMAAALACLVMSCYLIITASTGEPVKENIIADASSDIKAWEHFSPTRLNDLQQQGKPVFVDFTAKWCLTCQANRIVLMSDEVSHKLADLGVIKMEADWTRNDPEITKELRKHGRNGVPLYVLYTGDPEEPYKIMPQMLTPTIVFEHVKCLEE